MTRDPDGIRQAPAVQRSPECGDVAELGVREHGRDLQPRGARASDQRQRLTPFLLEGRAGRNLRHRAPIGVGEPGLRQTQQRAGQPRARPGPERGRHRDLAIRDFAQRATVLARHADRMGALLGTLVPSMINTPLRSGSTSRRGRQIRSVSQAPCVMKC
jgi:hypothetical protein